MAKDYTARPKGMKAVRLDLTADQHKALRRMAADAELPMSQFAREIVVKEIERRAKGAK